ncbi:TlyA family RNA methyltransferase [Brevibacterium daeguense]|uniref:TlyA family RNA methyltransferase n=1 Tax=Brevibacterium daeguense TaxID=909936 RepID=A0ABP8EMR3_9MICO
MTRLDVALVERGLVRSRNRAVREIAAGRVAVNGSTARKASVRVAPDDVLELTSADPWVARSAHKLLGALGDFGLTDFPAGLVCLDAGASTGGFTQVLLEHGARHVYAVDVGRDQLAPELAGDARVTDLSGHNLRELEPAWFSGPRPIDLVVADVSFISLTLLLDRLLTTTRPGGLLLLMVKPQFELTRSALDKHGVVTRAVDRAEAVVSVVSAVAGAGGQLFGWTPSRLPGPSGNREYFLGVRRAGSVGSGPAPVDPTALMTHVRAQISQEES